MQINAWGDLVESFIAAMALYWTSKVKLRKLKFVHVGNPRRKNGGLLRTYALLWGYQECKFKSSAGRGCQVH